MACQVVIEGIRAGPPYSGDQPHSATVAGRTTHDCLQVRFKVRAGGPASSIIVDQTVATTITDPGGALPRVATVAFSLTGQTIACGEQLYVEMICANDPSCLDSGMIVVACKPSPDEVPPTTQPPPSQPPLSRCLVFGAGSAIMLVLALVTFAIGVATSSPATTAAAAAIAVAALVLWQLWVFFCHPSLCARLAVLCWTFKRAFIFSLVFVPLLPTLLVSVMIILVIISYGSIAGILVERLIRRGCRVPSGRLPITQIPF
jgi:hypothetical protein